MIDNEQIWINIALLLFGCLILTFWQVDPYSGRLYQLTTGGVCRQTSISSGMIVPRKTVVSNIWSMLQLEMKNIGYEMCSLRM
jgi:hypothetical protein